MSRIQILRYPLRRKSLRRRARTKPHLSTLPRFKFTNTRCHVCHDKINSEGDGGILNSHFLEKHHADGIEANENVSNFDHTTSSSSQKNLPNITYTSAQTAQVLHCRKCSFEGKTSTGLTLHCFSTHRYQPCHCIDCGATLQNEIEYENHSCDETALAQLSSNTNQCPTTSTSIAITSSEHLLAISSKPQFQEIPVVQNSSLLSSPTSKALGPFLQQQNSRLPRPSTSKVIAIPISQELNSKVPLPSTSKAHDPIRQKQISSIPLPSTSKTDPKQADDLGIMSLPRVLPRASFFTGPNSTLVEIKPPDNKLKVGTKPDDSNVSASSFFLKKRPKILSKKKENIIKPRIWLPVNAKVKSNLKNSEVKRISNPTVASTSADLSTSPQDPTKSQSRRRRSSSSSIEVIELEPETMTPTPETTSPAHSLHSQETIKLSQMSCPDVYNEENVELENLSTVEALAGSTTETSETNSQTSVPEEEVEEVHVLTTSEVVGTSPQCEDISPIDYNDIVPGSEVYCCMLCDLVFRTKQALQLHISTHIETVISDGEDEPEVEIQYPNINKTTKYNYLKNVKKQFFCCLFCEALFTTIEDQSFHMSSCHQVGSQLISGSNPVNSVLEDKSLQCSICNKSFATIFTVELHKSFAHGQVDGNGLNVS